jgi:hypothetical protein
MAVKVYDGNLGDLKCGPEVERGVMAQVKKKRGRNGAIQKSEQLIVEE